MTTLQHILLVDLLPIVLIVAGFLIYCRMELRLLNARMKMLSDDADFWRQKYDIMTQEFFRFQNEFEANRKAAIKPPPNAQNLPPAGVKKLIADLESTDFENILNRDGELTLDNQLKEIEENGSRRHWVTTARPIKDKLTGLDLCAILFAQNLKWGPNGDYFSKGSDPENGYRLLSEKAKELARQHFPNNVKGDWILFDNNQTINDETMKRYGRPRRKHRQNKRMKEAADLRRLIKKIILTVKAQALANLIRIRAQRKLEELRGINYERAGLVNPKHNPSEFPPGGIIAKGPTELGGEFVVTSNRRTVNTITEANEIDPARLDGNYKRGRTGTKFAT